MDEIKESIKLYLELSTLIVTLISILMAILGLPTNLYNNNPFLNQTNVTTKSTHQYNQTFDNYLFRYGFLSSLALILLSFFFFMIGVSKTQIYDKNLFFDFALLFISANIVSNLFFVTTLVNLNYNTWVGWLFLGFTIPQEVYLFDLKMKMGREIHTSSFSTLIVMIFSLLFGSFIFLYANSSTLYCLIPPHIC